MSGAERVPTTGTGQYVYVIFRYDNGSQKQQLK